MKETIVEPVEKIVPPSVAPRFWPKVSAPNEHGCMLWSSAVSGGYGVFKIRPKMVYAHRVAWTLKRGDIPAGLRVLHKCDVPTCCNVDHLFLGTALDNNRDRARKGRGADLRGERHPQARLGPNDIRAMRSAARQGESATAIGRRLGVSHNHVSNILSGKRWAHLPI